MKNGNLYNPLTAGEVSRGLTKKPPFVKGRFGGNVSITGPAGSLSRILGSALCKHKKKPNPYRIRLKEAATYSPT